MWRSIGKIIEIFKKIYTAEKKKSNNTNVNITKDEHYIIIVSQSIYMKK